MVVPTLLGVLFGRVQWYELKLIKGK